jgi:cytochrome c553
MRIIRDKATMIKRPVLSALLLGLCAINAQAAGDVAAGKVKAYTCTGCHGIPGYKNTYPTYNVPRIAGQNAEYIAISLKAFRSGERVHNNMNLQAEALTDQDIEDIAAYLETQESSRTSAPGGSVKGKSKSEVCHACHGPTGIAVQPIYPNIGGQHRDYLEKTLRAFRDGSRQNAIMAGFAANLTDQDIKDISAWYASQQGLTEIKDK